MNKHVVFISVIVFVCLIFTFVAYQLPQWKTQSFVEEEVLRAKFCDMKGDFEGLDGWGNQVRYDRIVDTKMVVYLVISAGRDFEFETEDDITGQAIDLNKSRIIGDWIGKKAKQGFEGIKKGWAEPSKFDEEKK